MEHGAQRKKRSQKITNWRYGRPGGREKFYEATDEAWEELLEVVRTDPDINKVMNKMVNKMVLIKDNIYGRSTKTMKQLEKVGEEEKWYVKGKILGKIGQK